MRVAFSFQSFRSLLLATILIGLVLLGAWFVGGSLSPPDLELSRDHESSSGGDGSLVVQPVARASAGRVSISSRGATPLETRERVSAVLECLRESDANAMRGCVATAFEGADLGSVWPALCAELRAASEPEGFSVCLSACLANLPPDSLPDLLGSLSGACGDGQGIADLLARELATLRSEDPARAAELVLALLAKVNSSGPVTMIESRLLGLLAMAGDAACESAAESIALGELPAHAEAVDQAMLLLLESRDHGWDRWITVERVSASSSVRRYPATLSVLIATAMEPESWPGGDPSIAFDWLEGLLASPDARTVVAAVLLSDAEALRALMPDSRMERILAECDGIAREVGLVVDGVEWR